MSSYYKLNSGYKIPSVGFGVYQTGSNITARVVKTALQSGYRHVDSAFIYGNEKAASAGIAEFLTENPDVSREDIFYTTKIWTSDFGYEKAKKAIKTSLNNAASIGYIDLILLHAPKGPPSERLGAYKALQEAVAEGSVKSIGVSNYGIHHLQEIFSWPEFKVKPVINQVEINPWLQRVEVVEFCEKNDILIEAYSPLMRGKRLNEPQLVALANKYNKSPAQILIRWNLQKGYIPLPKSEHDNRIKSNIDVFDFEISENDLDSLGDKKEHFITGWDPLVWD